MGKCDSHLRFGGLSIYFSINFTLLSITQKSHSVKVNAFIYSKSTMCAKKQSKRCPWKSDLCALRRCETCAKKGLKILNGSPRFIFFYVAVITRGCPCFHSEHTSTCSSIFPFYQCAGQLFQIHSAQRRTTMWRSIGSAR